jgi:hypothetical protein
MRIKSCDRVDNTDDGSNEATRDDSEDVSTFFPVVGGTYSVNAEIQYSRIFSTYCQCIISYRSSVEVFHAIRDGGWRGEVRDV